jgi:hypothetical protein
MKTKTIAALILIIVFSGLCLAEDTGTHVPNLKKFNISRKVSEDAASCIECHSEQTPGIVADWASSRHAHANISCIDCHRASPADKDISKKHKMMTSIPISPIVSPKDCSRCHATEAAEYSKSKHANTLELIWKIDHWLNGGLNNEIERVTGCYACHGTVVKMVNGECAENTWPNVGVGRINPDGSKGSCSSCHTRHKFSIAEARKPEACGQCHLGPDHPQVEIYNESKHGAIYQAEGDSWNFTAAPGSWTPGVDYRTPTCSVCHMSGVNGVPATHDVTERLAWETQAPLTVRPEDFKPWPAKTDHEEERDKMKSVCRACHSPSWTDSHFVNLDKTIANYNENYFLPAKKLLTELYDKKLLNKDKKLDEEFEYEFYELWHHEGRRARFGAAMMAPDYAWWHGFYELKKRSMKLQDLHKELIEHGKPAKVYDIKGAGGSTKKPDFK